MWNYIFLSLFICLILTAFLHWLLYDLLIKIQSKNFPLDWAKDGKPYGMFYKPPGSISFQGIATGNRKLTRWILKKPNWVSKDEKGEQYYKFFRLVGILYYLLILLLAVSFIIIFLVQP